MKTILRILAVGLIAASFGQCFGQDTSKNAKVDEPLTGLGFQLKVGYFWKSKDQNSFYNLSYKGATLFTRGTAPSPTDIGKADPIDFGDQPLNISIAKGQTTIGGSLFQSANVTPITLKNGLGDRFRLNIGIDAQIEKDKQTTTHLGFEYSPKMKMLPIVSPNVRTDGETFIAFGMNGEHRSDPASTSTDIVTAIYRGRVGFGFDCAVSKNKLNNLTEYLGIAKKVRPDQLEAFITNLAVTGQNNDVKTMNLLGLFGIASVEAGFPINTTSLTVRAQGVTLQDALDKVLTTVKALDTDARQKIIDRFVGKINGPLTRLEKAIENPDATESQDYRDKFQRNQPRLAVYAEFEGAYAVTDKVFDRRYRSLYSGNIRYYFDSYRPDNGYISLRYENGFTRAEPNLRTNSLVVEVGFKF